MFTGIETEGLGGLLYVPFCVADKARVFSWVFFINIFSLYYLKECNGHICKKKTKKNKPAKLNRFTVKLDLININV